MDFIHIGEVKKCSIHFFIFYYLELIMILLQTGRGFIASLSIYTFDKKIVKTTFTLMSLSNICMYLKGYMRGHLISSNMVLIYIGLVKKNKIKHTQLI